MIRRATTKKTTQRKTAKSEKKRAPARTSPAKKKSPGTKTTAGTTKSATSRKSLPKAKAIAARKTSGEAPVTPAGAFDGLFAEEPAIVRAVAARLREIVLQVAPKAVESVRERAWLALYSDPTEFCGIQPGRDHCKLYLSRGAQLEDPKGLLEGRGRGIRHIKIRSPEEIPIGAVKKLLRDGRKLVRE